MRNTAPKNHVDAVVLGGGPAGCAAAIALARQGVSVTLLARTRRGPTPVGESLRPSVAPLLHRLGVWEAFIRQRHLPSPGTVAVWGDSDPYEDDFIFSPYGNGWQLDRTRFDEMLAIAAGKSGAVLHSDTRLVSCTKNASGGWGLAIQCNGRDIHLDAPFIVDATGRASWLVRRLGERRVVCDRLVGIVGTFERRHCGSDRDSRTLVEAARNGWWYSTTLPNECLRLAYMTDAYLPRESPNGLNGFLTDNLSQTTYTRERANRYARIGALRTVSASSHRMERVAGANWLAVGDAAMAWDPLSGQGIAKALESGIRAAETVIRVYSGERRALNEFQDRIDADWADYVRSHNMHYRAEQRWPTSPFWHRRQREASFPIPSETLVLAGRSILR